MSERITASEAAREIGVAPITIIRWIKAGKMSGVKRSGFIWVDMDEVRKVDENSRLNPIRKRFLTA